MCKVISIIAALSILLIEPAIAQTRAASGELATITTEIESLKQGQAAILQQLKAMQQVLQRMAQPPRRPAPVQAVSLVLKGTGDDPVLGDKDARLVLVEFSDYQCPFCRRHATTTMAQLKKEYVSTGKIRYMFRDFPIAQIHPNAPKAAEAANCAGDQGKYWEMHDLLFRNQRQLGAAELPGHAAALGLDKAAFESCLASGRHRAEIQQDMADGAAAGVTGTPSFFLAVAGPSPGTLKTMTMIRGAVPFAAFKSAIDAALASLDKADKAKTDKAAPGKPD